MPDIWNQEYVEGQTLSDLSKANTEEVIEDEPINEEEVEETPIIKVEEDEEEEEEKPIIKEEEEETDPEINDKLQDWADKNKGDDTEEAEEVDTEDVEARNSIIQKAIENDFSGEEVNSILNMLNLAKNEETEFEFMLKFKEEQLGSEELALKSLESLGITQDPETKELHGRMNSEQLARYQEESTKAADLLTNKMQTLDKFLGNGNDRISDINEKMSVIGEYMNHVENGEENGRLLYDTNPLLKSMTEKNGIKAEDMQALLGNPMELQNKLIGEDGKVDHRKAVAIAKILNDNTFMEKIIKKSSNSSTLSQDGETPNVQHSLADVARMKRNGTAADDSISESSVQNLPTLADLAKKTGGKWS
jgi:hypothetical protein